MASTTSDLTLLGRKLGALDYNPEVYVKEIARRSVGGHDLLHQRNNIKVLKIPKKLLSSWKRLVLNTPSIEPLMSNRHCDQGTRKD